MDKSMFKKSGTDLEAYLQFKRKGGSVPPKRGKGSYKRKPKHRSQQEKAGG